LRYLIARLSLALKMKLAFLKLLRLPFNKEEFLRLKEISKQLKICSKKHEMRK